MFNQSHQLQQHLAFIPTGRLALPPSVLYPSLTPTMLYVPRPSDQHLLDLALDHIWLDPTVTSSTCDHQLSAPPYQFGSKTCQDQTLSDISPVNNP